MRLSEKLLKQKAFPQVYERAEGYLSGNRISSLIRYGEVYCGQITGSTRYDIVLDLREENWTGTCTCPYDQRGYCKHIIAVGMAVIRGEISEDYPTLPPEKEESLNLVNINEVRDHFRQDENYLFSDLLNHWLARKNLRNAVRVLLGVYEGILPGKTFEELLEKVLASSKSCDLTSKAAREILEMIFVRWDKYEQSYRIARPEGDFRYHLPDWESLFCELTRDKIVAHYLEMKFLGYDINRESLPVLAAKMKSYE